jgi:hypothetical protein
MLHNLLAGAIEVERISQLLSGVRWFRKDYVAKEFKKRLSEAEHDQAINKLRRPSLCIKF